MSAPLTSGPLKTITLGFYELTEIEAALVARIELLKQRLERNPDPAQADEYSEQLIYARAAYRAITQ